MSLLDVSIVAQGAGAPRDDSGAIVAQSGDANPNGTASSANVNTTPLDDTAESVPDTAATAADAFARRAEVVLLAQQSRQQFMQLRLDRMKDEFNAS